MNFSARSLRRKWACDGCDVAPAAMVSAAAATVALSWLMVAAPAAAKSAHRSAPVASEPASKPADIAAKVPLPQPRPAEAPAREAAKGKDDAPRGEAMAGAKEEAKAPPPPSACRLALTDEVAIAPSIPPIKGPGGCGGEDLVRLEAVVLPDKRRVALTPAATMRCPMATAVANWVRNDVAPLAERLGSAITALDNFDSYQCRGRNNVAGAQLSEHGRANALDVHGFKLSDGRMIDLTDRTQPRDLREAVLHSVCTHFSTVLGPDSDWYHEDHIHLDLMERRNNYRICQWDVLDPLPKVAPLMPAARPEDAPPRETEQAGAESSRKTASTPAERNGTSRGDSEETEAGTSTAGNSTAPSTQEETERSDTEERSPAQKPADSARNRRTASKSPPEQQKVGAAAPEARSSTGKPLAGGPSAASDKDKTGDAAGRDQRAQTSQNGERASLQKPASRKRHHSRRSWDPFRGLF
ncbi:extensin family protein [Bradyrhizobium ontarionense]|uniref:extensin family protein n=1 Tax=Bradyrhizobium ontarionense TaxID=2898149 RepID=UPI003CE55D73